MSKLLTWDPKKNKSVLVGEIAGTTLFRDVQVKHFMRVVGGYGIQEPAFQQALSQGVKKIVLKEVETSQRWEANVKTWLLNSKLADYGHGKQRFLGLSYMTTHQLKESDLEGK